MEFSIVILGVIVAIIVIFVFIKLSGSKFELFKEHATTTTLETTNDIKSKYINKYNKVKADMTLSGNNKIKEYYLITSDYIKEANMSNGVADKLYHDIQPDIDTFKKNLQLSSKQGCKDTNSMCKSWANSRECHLNPNYMLDNCPVSCAMCTP